MNTDFAKTKGLEPDAWLSSVLGRSVYRITLNEELKTACKEAGSMDALVPPGRSFFYAKVSDSSGKSYLEKQGFFLADTNLLFSKLLRPTPSEKTAFDIRLAQPFDEQETVELARRSFAWSRFHRDPAIGVDAANGLKAEWVRNFFKGKRGEAMILAEKEGKIAGFLQLLKQGRTLTIDLIAVDRGFRGQGAAAAMIAFAESANPECESIQAGTQVVNAASISLYERMGFRVISTSYVYHRHSEGARK